MNETLQSGASPKNWKITLAYDGTDFHGWQVQPDKPTIQGELQAALGRVTGETPLPQGSGRTDAGVHALAQVASFCLQARIPADNLRRALNRTLPAAIRILDTCTVPESFHARHSAVAKTYEYRIRTQERGENDECPPFVARYVFACSWRLDIGLLQQAAAHVVGEHDFLSFAATDPDLATRFHDESGKSCEGAEPHTTVRTIFSSSWHREQTAFGPLLVYRVRGNGFLHHMVRNLAGTLIDVGRGKILPDAIPAILAARSRPEAGPTAPARALFLHSVEYK